jgi:NADH:ubiquinone oxidoreductase subunit 4 (subunit M)
LGLDGISFFLVGLSALLVPICILVSWKSINHMSKEFLISLFVIIFLLVGVFTILDILGFYILFEGILIPMFIIIGV